MSEITKTVSNHKKGAVGIFTFPTLEFAVQLSGSLGPNSASMFDLGSSGSNWRNVYAATFVGTASVALSASWAPGSTTPDLSAYVSRSYISGSTNRFYGTASFAVSASYATSASYAPGTPGTLGTGSTYPFTASVSLTSSVAVSASYATSASYAPGTPGTLGTGSTYPFTASVAVSASYALSASWAPGGQGGSLGTGSTYPFTASVSLTSSVATSASYALSASYAPGIPGTLGTGSTYPFTASVAISASYALSASYAPSIPGTLGTGSTYPFTASVAVTSSYALSSSYSVSASYASSASYAITSSQANTASFVSSAWNKASMTAVSRSSNNTNDAVESSLASVVIPGGTLGPNDWLKILTTWTYTNSVSTKRLFVDIGGTDFTEYSATKDTVLAQLYTALGNTGTTGSQKGQGEFLSGFGTSGFDIVTSTLDTAQNQTIDFRCRWQVNISSSAEYIQLERYLIEVIRVN